MALVPEARPVTADPGLLPVSSLQPQVGVWFDATGAAHRAYIQAPAPGTSGLDGSAANAVAVTPSDSTLLLQPSRAIYIGATGNVSVLTVGGQTVTFLAVPPGSILPVQVARVNATGTSATNIISLS